MLTRRASQLAVLAAVSIAAGCAQRNEIIAVVDVGAGGGGAGGGPPLIAFSSPQSYGHTCGTVSQVAVAELDGDDHLDVLSAGDCLLLHRGLGDGTVQVAETVASGVGTALALGHVDALHHDDPSDPLDVVTRAADPRVFAGDGMGAFLHLHDLVGGGSGGPGSFSLGPLAGNSTTDLVTSSGVEVVVWPGDGTGAFGPEHPFALAGPVHSLALVDLDEDGALDVVVASDGVQALINQGTGSLAAPVAASVQDAGAVRFVVTGSVDELHDDCADVVTVDGRPGAPGGADAQVRVLLGDCHGGLTEHAALTAPGAVHAAIADVNHDGHADLLIARAGVEPSLQVALGAGDGSFEDGGVHAVTGEPSSLAVGDLDEDGRLDVVVASRGVGVLVLLNRGE